MNWLIAFTRALSDIGLMAIAASIIWEMYRRHYRPPFSVSAALILFGYAGAINIVLRLLRALS